MTTKNHQPTWESENVPTNYSNKFPNELDTIIYENETLKSFLLDNGWKFRDCCNVWEQGFVLTFEKKVKGTRILFDFHWVDENHVYWWGTMRVSFNYFPSEKLLCPIGFFEIDSITKRFMNKEIFQKMENNLIALFESQLHIG